MLVTSPERLALLAEALGHCPDLRHVVVDRRAARRAGLAQPALRVVRWNELLAAPPRAGHRVIDADMAAILYTSGSTGKPKGVVLSHRNMVAGAKSVASYLENDVGRHAAGRAAAVVRRRLQPADHGLPRRLPASCC